MLDKRYWPGWMSPRRRTVWYPIVLTGLIGVSALIPLSPLMNAETGQGTEHVTLCHSVAYTLLAPLSTLCDMLTLLSLWQHVVMVVWGLLMYGVWRVSRGRDTQRSRIACVGREVQCAGVYVACLVGVYGCSIVLPRPMARLMLRDPDLVAIDFHSHTNASRDASRSFDAEANRRWHDAAGFNIAYISDHRSLAGARAAARKNPQRAGEGVTLLQALESGDEDEHIIALRVDTTQSYTANGTWHEPDYARVSTAALDTSLIILTIPGNVDTLPGIRTNGSDPFYAIELSDGSPKGIAQEQRDRAQILRLADILNLALVVGSDNHGWGYTAVAWSVFRIPGWRQMNPTQIDAAIRRTIRKDRRDAGTVVIRRSPDPGASWLLLAATPITAPWIMMRTLDIQERVSWVLWGWMLWGISVVPLVIQSPLSMLSTLIQRWPNTGAAGPGPSCVVAEAHLQDRDETR